MGGVGELVHKCDSVGLVHGCDEVGIRYTNVNSRAVGKRMSRNGKLVHEWEELESW